MQDSVRFLVWCFWHGAVEHRTIKEAITKKECDFDVEKPDSRHSKVGKDSAVSMVQWASKDPSHGSVLWSEQADLVTTCRYSIGTCHKSVTGS